MLAVVVSSGWALGRRQLCPPHLVIASHIPPFIWENLRPFGTVSWLGGGVGDPSYVPLSRASLWHHHPVSTVAEVAGPQGKWFEASSY